MTYTKPCPPPGVYHGISDEEYHSWRALNASLLRSGHTEREWQHAIANPKKPTGAMRLGTLIHQRVLQPSVFKSLDLREVENVDMPVCDGRKRASKRTLAEGSVPETWEQAAVQCGGIPIVDGWRDYLESMAAMIYSNPEVARLFEHVRDDERELSIVWEDKGTGVLCKARIDALSRMPDDDDGAPAYYPIDIKTSQAIGDVFAGEVFNLGYDIAFAHYCDGLHHAHGLDRARIRPVWVVLQKQPVLDCQVQHMDPAYLEVGRTRLVSLKARYARALLTGKWPGWADGDLHTTVCRPPYWVMERFIGGEV